MDTDETTAPQPAAETGADVSIQARRPNIVPLIMLGVFVGFLVSQAASDPSPGLLIVALLFSYLGLIACVNWLRPERLTIRQGVVTMRLIHRLSTQTANIADACLRGATFCIRFHDLSAVTFANSGSRKALAAKEARGEYHLAVPGGRFTLAQVNQVRSALGFSEQIEDGQRLSPFDARLLELTPRPVVTYGLLGLNVAVLIVMAAQGVNVLEPNGDALLKWGANFGPKTTSGEWWRTITSMFLHIGILHLLFNMWALKMIGPTVERLVGSGRFLVGYLFCGFCGSLASVLWSPQQLSAGASGAIFGLFGLLPGLLVRHHRTLPREVLIQHRNQAIFFVVLNIYFSFSIKGIDIAAHFGGLAAGFVYGLLIAPVFVDARPALRRLRLVLTAGCCLAAGVVAFQQLLTPVADLRAALQRMFAVETQVVNSYQAAIEAAKKDGATSEQIALRLRKDVVAPWHNAREEFEALPHVPKQDRSLFDAMVEYLKRRDAGWNLIAEAIEHDDANRMQRGHRELDEAVQFLNGWIRSNPGSMLSPSEQGDRPAD